MQTDVKKHETKQFSTYTCLSSAPHPKKKETWFRKTLFRESLEHVLNKCAGLPSTVVVSELKTRQPINMVANMVSNLAASMEHAWSLENEHFLIVEMWGERPYLFTIASLDYSDR